jgi:hypothetical protein
MPLGTRDYILLSQIRIFPVRRLLLLPGPQWRYSTPPPHEIISLFFYLQTLVIQPRHGLHRNTLLLLGMLVYSSVA